MKNLETVQSMMKKAARVTLAVGFLIGFSAEATAWDRDILYPNQILFAGQAIVSKDCRYHLTMQGDGNLVMYANLNRPMYASNTVGQYGYAVMQHDGNFVLYKWDGAPLGSSDTWGHPGAYLVMENNAWISVMHGSTYLWFYPNFDIAYYSSTCPGASKTVWEPDYNRFGGDYVSYSMSYPWIKAEVCAYWCSQDGRCKAYTWVPPGVQGDSARCWLKDQVPARSYAPGLVSGYVFRR